MRLQTLFHQVTATAQAQALFQNHPGATIQDLLRSDGYPTSSPKPPWTPRTYTHTGYAPRPRREAGTTWPTTPSPGPPSCSGGQPLTQEQRNELKELKELQTSYIEGFNRGLTRTPTRNPPSEPSRPGTDRPGGEPRPPPAPAGWTRRTRQTTTRKGGNPVENSPDNTPTPTLTPAGHHCPDSRRRPGHAPSPSPTSRRPPSSSTRTSGTGSPSTRPSTSSPTTTAPSTSAWTRTWPNWANNASSCGFRSNDGEWMETYSTHSGRRKAREIAGRLDAAMTRYIDDTVQWAQGLRFRDLVASVNQTYPDYAGNSVFANDPGGETPA